VWTNKKKPQLCKYTVGLS